jgi:hypothetical protein
MENYLKTEHRKVYADWVHKTVKILNSTSPQVLKQGVYELPNGDVYVVKLNKAKTHLYAKQLVDFKGKRLTFNSEVTHFKYIYVAGAIDQILPEYRMSWERAKAFVQKFRQCVRCGHHLSDATSVEQGVGPICITYFDSPPLQINPIETDIPTEEKY